jgi:hypothetical protein
MPVDKIPTRRMTLRQLLTYSEKCSRDLIDHFRGFLGPRLAEFRDLSRPVRRRSSYPTMMAVKNSLKKLQEAGDEARALAENLSERLQEIREHAQREQANRSAGG